MKDIIYRRQTFRHVLCASAPLYHLEEICAHLHASMGFYRLLGYLWPSCVECLVSYAAQKASWEELVPEVALKQGAVLVADERPTFAMHWASIQEFWQVLLCAMLCHRHVVMTRVLCANMAGALSCTSDPYN